MDVNTGKIYCCANGIHIYVNTSDFLVIVLCMVVPVKPVCVVQGWARLVYNAYPVLVYLQDNVVQSLDSMATSLLSIASNDLWSVMVHTFLAKQ